MAVKVNGGVITDQTLTGSLRFFQISGTGVFTNTLGTTGIVLSADPVVAVVGAGVGTGTGYEVNDTLTVVGGTGTAAELTVDAISGGGADGPVYRVSVSNAGSYSVLPSNPISVTGGEGSGATFNLTFSSSIIIPDASITEREHYVAFGKPVVGSAADQALAVVAQRATIVQIAVVSNNVIQFAVENTGFGWADAAAIQAAVRALGAAVVVPDATDNGTTVDLSGVTVTEKFFSSGLA